MIPNWPWILGLLVIGVLSSLFLPILFRSTNREGLSTGFDKSIQLIGYSAVLILTFGGALVLWLSDIIR